MTPTGTTEPPAVTGSETSQRTPRIAVCVATYRRPHLLLDLLNGLESMALPDGHDVEIRVVDNDQNESARKTVEDCAGRSRFTVRYATQPERNIALTRNKALDAGPADLLAFIDDDEVPTRPWLTELVAGLGDTFDLVIGNVEPKFETEPPAWVERGRFHHKSSGNPGDIIGWNGTRTSNTMLRGSWVYDRGVRFDERYGKSGAEDTEMFKRIHDAGGVFGAAPKSVVLEHVHADQTKLGWLTKRFWNNGINYERLVANDGGRHPLVRFAARTIRGTANLIIGAPLALVGRGDRAAHAILDLSRAFGGLVGWLAPSSIERSSGYRSSGCE